MGEMGEMGRPTCRFSITVTPISDDVWKSMKSSRIVATVSCLVDMTRRRALGVRGLISSCGQLLS